MNGVLFAVRHILGIAWRTDRRRLLVGGTLVTLGMLATPLVALALRGVVNNVVEHQVTLALVFAAVAALALVAELLLGHFAHLSYFELGELAELRLNRRLLRAVNGSAGLAQAEDPGFAQTVDLLREDLVKMRATVHFCLQFVGLVAQSLLTAVIVVQVSPFLLLLPVAAVLPVWAGKWGQRELQRGREAAAASGHALASLRGGLVSRPAQVELRMSSGLPYLLDREADLQQDLDRALRRAERRQAWITTLGQGGFAVAYIGAVLLAISLVRNGHGSLGDLVMVVVLASQIGQQVALGTSLLSNLYSAAQGMRRFDDLAGDVPVSRDDELGDTGDRQASRPAIVQAPPVPAPVQGEADGITLDGVSFTYPGATRTSLDGVSLVVPAGSTVALVGENGAGKSTLLKLVLGLYRPDQGQVRVGSAPLLPEHLPDWREHVATMFQDFATIELELQRSVGVGRLAQLDDSAAVLAAITRADARPLLDKVDGELGTVVGSAYAEGVGLSGGQWQSVAFSRTCMRPSPRLLVLDEPGHALDAFAEQRMCDAFGRIARDIAVQVGGVTMFVSHRLSTVRLADLIVVMDQGRVVEQGSHAELMASGGRYAELFSMQARAYA